MKRVSAWIWTLVLMGVMACEKSDPPPPAVSIDAELAPYVEAFLAEGRVRGRELDPLETGLTVAFSNQLDPGVAGICYFGDYLVQIDQLYWNTLNEDQKEFLMYHELGHCLLRRVHLDLFFDDGVPRSIMKSGTSATTISTNPVPFFGFRKAYYLDELFEVSNPDESSITRRFAYGDSNHQTRRLIWEDSLQTRVLNRLDTGLDEFQIDLAIEELPELGLSVELA
ncbi:MAG: putative metallopeptidase, partial [Bacteroidota bacterium]